MVANLDDIWDGCRRPGEPLSLTVVVPPNTRLVPFLP